MQLESDVVRDTVGTMTTCYIRNVSVVSAPLKFHGQPRDDIYYLTMPNYAKAGHFYVFIQRRLSVKRGHRHYR